MSALLSVEVHAQDEMLGADKAAHFLFSAAIAAGSYSAVRLSYNRDELAPWLLPIVATLGLGLGKEILDAGWGTGFSFADLLWDAVGLGVGLLLAGGIDAWLHSAFSAIPVETNSAGSLPVLHTEQAVQLPRMTRLVNMAITLP